MLPRRKTYRAIAVLAGVVALSTAACGGGGTSSSSASSDGNLGGTCKKLEKTTIKLGVPLNTYTLAPVYNALDGDLFKKQGVEVKLVVLTGGTTPQAALLGGSVDLVETGLSGLLQPIEQGVAARTIWGGILATPYDVYAEPGITSMDDIKGKSIHMTSLPSDQGVMVRHYLGKVGLTIKDVKLQQGGGSPIGLQGLERGSSDTSVLVPPTTFQAEDAGFKKIASMSDYISEYPMHTVQGMDKYVDANPCTIKAFLRGLSQGTAMAKSDKQVTAERVAKYAQVPTKYAARAVDSFQSQMFEDGRIPDSDSMKKFWEIYSGVKVIKAEIPLDKWFDDRFVASFDSWK